MKPSFEILANYTVYDFEKIAPGINSLSFRQVGYRDSIIVGLGKKYSLHSSILIRYYETGILYWNSFAETPQNSNFEQFVKLMFVRKNSGIFSYGIGARYYKLSQKSLTYGISVYSGREIDHISIGPEVFVRARFSSGTECSIEGWYEFVDINNRRVNIPNMFLVSKFNI